MTKKQSVAQSLFFWLQALSVALVVLILVFSFVGRIITVDGPSMQPTLQNGDILLLQSAFYSPKQGDVVVLTKDFASYTDRPIVKRIIAVGGQTVRIDYDEDVVYVDGVALDEPYILESDMLPAFTIEELTIPEGYVFVMGDNRNNSTDSRYSDLGAIDERYILGKVVMVLFSFSNFGLIH
ncbi:MAG: signal peptidase I [Oscillospiraceae bacterium]|nr:signal peptidase I [Oscillospiraceae bacterium]